MMAVPEVKQWLSTLGDNNGVAIDEGGLSLVEIDGSNGEPTGVYLEVGGTPDGADVK